MKQPAGRITLNHTHSSLTAPLPVGSQEPTSGPVLRFVVWREQDAMRQRKIDFGVIPRSFRDEKELRAPHCRREH
jgi:hypothetical protein